MMNQFKQTFNTIICEMIDSEYHVDIVSNVDMGEIVASHIIKNNNSNMSNDFANLKKLLFDDEMNWYLLKNNTNHKIVACAACRENNYNSLFINELFSFQKGCGAILLLHILNNSNNYNIIYLNSDWSDTTGKLDQYYKQSKFQLTEYITHRDHYDVHYFYKNNKLNSKLLNRFIDEMFI